jgi:hypothetical protein
LLSSCYKVDDGNRLATRCSNKTVRNKLLRACCHQLVNNWEQAVRTHLVDKLRDFYECNLASKATKETNYRLQQTSTANCFQFPEKDKITSFSLKLIFFIFQDFQYDLKTF